MSTKKNNCFQRECHWEINHWSNIFFKPNPSPPRVNMILIWNVQNSPQERKHLMIVWSGLFFPNLKWYPKNNSITTHYLSHLGINVENTMKPHLEPKQTASETCFHLGRHEILVKVYFPKLSSSWFRFQMLF